MKTVLNLGCGKARIRGSVNVDLLQTRYADQVVNLLRFPWPWGDESVDEIYIINFIEHVDDLIATLRECHRILRPGGLLHIQCPYFSSYIALTEIDHKRAFGRNTFAVLEGGGYVFPEPMFRTELNHIRYLALLPRQNPWVPFDFGTSVPAEASFGFLRRIGAPFTFVVQKLIDACPVLFERLWQYWVGGADEIIYRGRRI